MIRRQYVIACDPCQAEPPDGRTDTKRSARAVAVRAGFRQDRNGVDRCPACRATATTTDAAPAALAGQAA